MKINTLLSALIVFTLSVNCSKEEHVKTGCDFDDWTEVKAQIGRIYKWTDSEPNYYYIGNTQPSSSGINGGYVPCNELAEEFRVEGLIVEYSGILKETAPGLDPLFVYITLSEIREAN